MMPRSLLAATIIVVWQLRPTEGSVVVLLTSNSLNCESIEFPNIFWPETGSESKARCKIRRRKGRSEALASKLGPHEGRSK